MSFRSPIFAAFTHQGLSCARRLALPFPAPRRLAAPERILRTLPDVDFGSRFDSSSDSGSASRSGSNTHGSSDPAAWDIEDCSDVTDWLPRRFLDGSPLVLVCAIGLVVRILAPHLHDKRKEPPVVCVSESGESIVPVLGASGGANALARRLAESGSGHAALTGIAGSRFRIALEHPPEGWVLHNPKDYKTFVADVLSRGALRSKGMFPWKTETGLPLTAKATHVIEGTYARRRGSTKKLIYHPRVVCVGVGCSRGAPPEETLSLVRKCVRAAKIAAQSIAGVFSVEAKSDAPAVHAVARYYGVPARFFSVRRLEEETCRLENPSEAVWRALGCWGVAEAAALAASGAAGRLISPKQKSAHATCALALSPSLVAARSLGRAQGRLAVIGIGPGDCALTSGAGWLTPQARTELERAEVLFGYRRYLSFLGSLCVGKRLCSSEIGQERERVDASLQAASEGRRVGLICSGDAGIYALAGLTLERRRLHADWRRVSLEIVPGISALQVAAARVGAPLGHDFCAISLSDLLTPWGVIAGRLAAAARADFVVALYNPASSKRRSGLREALRILRTARKDDTPVVVARRLGRRGETLRIVTLGDFLRRPPVADMSTIVLVGSSTTKWHDGVVYTPRGYSNASSFAPEGSSCGTEVSSRDFKSR